MSNPDQIPLDFDGTDPEQQLRKRWAEQVRISGEADDSLTARFEEWIREDFLAGRPCSVSLDRVTGSQRIRSERCLERALRRAGIPKASLGLEPVTSS